MTMTRDPLDILEHIKVKPLSGDERSHAFMSIEKRLRETPVISPFSAASLFHSKAFGFAFAFLVITSTVGVSDRARPGDMLFPVERAVERVERALDPASAIGHARERVDEFASLLPPAVDEGFAMRAEKAPAAEGTDMAMTAMMVTDSAENAMPVLPPELREAIERTSQELYALEAEATLRGDAEMLAEIQTTIAGFEALIDSL